MHGFPQCVSYSLAAADREHDLLCLLIWSRKYFNKSQNDSGLGAMWGLLLQDNAHMMGFFCEQQKTLVQDGKENKEKKVTDDNHFLISESVFV